MRGRGEGEGVLGLGREGGEGKEPKGEKESGPDCLVLFLLLSFFLYSIYSNKLFEFKI
jgi:hypothetical protein